MITAPLNSYSVASGARIWSWLPDRGGRHHFSASLGSYQPQWHQGTYIYELPERPNSYRGYFEGLSSTTMSLAVSCGIGLEENTTVDP